MQLTRPRFEVDCDALEAEMQPNSKTVSMAEYQFSLYISHAKMMHRRAEAIVALQNENMCLYAFDLISEQ